MKYKRLIFSFIILTCFFLFTPNVLAFNTSISSKQNINPNERFEVTFSVTNATDLAGIDAKLNYDSSKLRMIENLAVGLNDFNISVDSRLVVFQTNGLNNSFNFARITFEATNNFKIGQNTTISLSDVKGSNLKYEVLTGKGSSRKINLVAPLSSNANLKEIKIDGRNVSGFSANKTTYNINVDNNTTKINLQATPADSKATVSGLGNKNLNLYRNTFRITVTAENKTTKTYTININRADNNGNHSKPSSNSFLKNLEIENYNLDFKQDEFNYHINVDNATSKLNIKATPKDESATVKINSPELKVGSNQVTIVVTAEDKTHTTYTINVNRSDNIPTLKLTELNEKITKIEGDSFQIDVFDELPILTTEKLKLINEHKKNIIINYFQSDILTAKWYFKGENINYDQEINTKFYFTSNFKKEINELTNYRQKTHLLFEHKGAFPEGTKLNLRISEYDDNTLLHLYYYNEESNQIELITSDLKIENGFVEFEIEHASNYFLTPILIDNSFSHPIFTYILGIIIIIQSAVIIKLELNRKKIRN